MVVTVETFADFYATDDQRVREAFQTAVFVSTGIDMDNVNVAPPRKQQLCGLNVSTLPDGVEIRERRLASHPLAAADARTTRRAELFGTSDLTVLREENDRAIEAASERRMKRGFDELAAQDVMISFSIINVVEGLHSFILYSSSAHL